MKFFSFWRSLASFRVRIALNLKNIPAEVIFVDLDANAHRDPEYRRINPQMALPALVEDDGTTLFQSLAILEYLDEKYPSPPLLPADINGRARVRALALMVACEGHPLLTPRVRRYLDHELNLRDTQQAAWRRHWIVETLAAMEGHLAGHKDTGRFCHGDAPTLAGAAAPVAAPAAASPPASVDEAGFAVAYAGPAVRKLARELRVDLGRVKGSGDKGRIVKADGPV